jgi:anti-sigma-K factor RskA
MSEPTDMPGMSCDEFAQVAAELALGVLTGRERAAALAHLDGCESCRELVRELTMTGEELLALLPSREPPAGFETRVLERIGLAAPNRPGPGHRPSVERRADRGADGGADRPAAGRPPGRPRGKMRRVFAAAAVAVALVVAGLGGWGLRTATAPSVPSASSATSQLSTAALVTSAHQTVGMVFVYNRSPWWMYMSVNLGDVGNVTVKCQLENVHGQFTTIGNFRLSEGYGTWGSPYAIGDGIVGARLLSANNTVLATANFR